MLTRLLRKLRTILSAPLRSALLRPLASEVQAAQRNAGLTKATQVLLTMTYRRLLLEHGPLCAFADIGFRVYSQNDEDGILLYLFSIIGTTNKKVVDIGSSDTANSNSANLIINHGWVALLIDGHAPSIRKANEFYRSCPDTASYPPAIVHVWTTRENINSVITDYGFSGEIDLLCIDIDGIDYWIWDAIECITPRVVVVEYQDIIGPSLALALPYNPHFRLSDYAANSIYPNYCGASLQAFVKLGRRKGYRLVGSNRYGFNAFFMRSGVGEQWFLEVTADSCLQHPWNKFGIEKRWPAVKDMEWLQV